jgi:futalosine hydrolase
LIFIKRKTIYLTIYKPFQNLLVMPLKVLFVTATSMEASALKKTKGILSGSAGLSIGNVDISLLVGGIGSISTAWSLMHWISLHGKPDLAVNAGIAGSFNNNFRIGDVVMVESECFADLGIEDGKSFLSLYEAGLSDSNEFPFTNGVIAADMDFISKFKGVMKNADAITLNTVTGSEESRLRLLSRYKADIETMEGASFFYICKRERIPFLSIRAVSNKIEKRNKENWDVQLALDNLAIKLNEVFLMLD